MAQVIKVNGESIQTAPAIGKSFSLKELQTIVGGYIEVIRLPNESWMVLNEEGKILNLPKNGRATVMGAAAGIGSNDFICGDVLIATSEEIGEESA